MKKFSNSVLESIKFGRHEIPIDKILYKDSDFFIIYDGFPTSPGHILIITNGLEETYFDLSDSKKIKLTKLLEGAKEIIETDYQPDGYNIGMNCGKSAGQTVMQFHCHLIPRYDGDVENPAGGVRHSVMGKGYY
jgi:diadenosine tetraphosphate (Ap4A) HIT family hydrolase